MSYQTIDITPLTEQTRTDLHEAIVKAVKDTQAVVIRALPNELVMTKAQYDLLQNDPEMQGMYASNERIYVTPECVMEVIVK